jgi:hypothetical protein
MDSRVKMIMELREAGHGVKEIARRMNLSEDWVEGMLASEEVQKVIERGKGEEDDGPELYSGEEIKFFVEKMWPKALKVIEKVLVEPEKVTATQWKATEWVLSKASAIQEMNKDGDGMGRIVNQFILNDRAAGALEKLAGEWNSEDWLKALEAGVKEVPPGIE